MDFETIHLVLDLVGLIYLGGMPVAFGLAFFQYQIAEDRIWMSVLAALGWPVLLAVAIGE